MSARTIREYAKRNAKAPAVNRAATLADAIAPFLDSNCRHCAATLAQLRATRSRSGPYGTLESDGTLVPGFTLRPDHNSSGAITAWHLTEAYNGKA